LKRAINIGETRGVPAQLAVQGKTGSGEYIDYRGEKVIAAWRYIPIVHWGMVARIDINEAFSEVSKVRRIVVLIVVATVVMCSWGAVYFAGTISGPIGRLSRGADIIGGGNLDYFVGIEGKDEIAALSRAFDTMTRKLKATTASRDELNREVLIRKRIEEELRRSNENLEQFAYVASHDLQEPLRMMSSYASLLERRYKSRLDKDADEFIGYIVDGASRMQALINDLLAFSRLGRTEAVRAVVDLNTVLAAVKEGLAAAISECGAVITNDTLPTVYGNESHFTQLFLNLIGNAIKFRGLQEPRIHIGVEQYPGEVVISVRDNGIGIEPQYFEKIFLIFQRLHARSKYPGTGIGLAICKKIVENNGGRLWVESQAGDGARFCFTIAAKGVKDAATSVSAPN
jgi:signal transduction histidine kinase